MLCLSNGKYQNWCENWLFIGVFIIKILFLKLSMSEVRVAVSHFGPEYDLCGLFSVLRRSRAQSAFCLLWRVL